MSTPTTIPEAVTALTTARPKLRRNIGALVNAINGHQFISSTDQVVVPRDAAVVLAEADMKDRAIQLVKDLGSNKTNAEIWTILQQLPHKQVNATAKTYIRNGATMEDKLERAIAWTEILAVRDEANHIADTTGMKFSDPTFAEASVTEEQTTTSLWVDVYNGGVPVTREQVEAVM